MKKVFKTMAFTLLGLVLSVNLFAVDPAVDDVIFKEEFTVTAKTEAKDYKFNGTTTWSGSKDGLSYASSSSSSYMETATAKPITSANFFFVKSSESNLTMSGIAIPSNVEKVSISFVSNKTNVNCTYSFNGTNYSTGATSVNGTQSFEIECKGKTSISLKFAKTGTSSNARIDDVTITVTKVATTEGETTVSISPDGGEFLNSQEITLTPTPANAAVYYTTNGNEPTASSTPYEAPFTISSSCTIKAIAIKQGSTKQNVASAEFTKITPLSTMGDIFNASAAAGDYYITFDNWVISGVKGNNAYLTDNNGKGLILYKKDHGFVAGDVLSGTVQCALTKYSGSAEITNLTASTDGLTVTKGGSLTAYETSIAALGGVNTGALINLGDLTYNGSNIFSDGTNTITAYNGIMSSLPTWNSGLVHTVKGIYIQFNTTQEIAPRDANDIVEKQADKFAITIADDIQNGSVSVQGGKTQAAEDESVTLLIAPNTGYKLGTLTVDVSDVTAFVSDNKYTFSMPGHAVNVSATFAAKDVYTITWKVKGQADATTDVVEGETLSLPTAPTFEGYKFIGWTASAIEGKQSTSPALLANNTIPTENKTYYAVFAVVTGQDPMVGNYTLNYDPDVKDKTLGYDNAVDVTAEDGSEWVVKAYKQNGMQINTGKGAYIKVPNCIANISSINITTTNSAYKAVKFAETTDGDALATGTEATSQTLDLSSKSVKSGYILPTGNVQITKVVVNYSGTKDHLDNYTTNPTTQVKIHFELGEGTGTFNDVSIDEGSNYEVTSDEPTPATGYEFVDWTNGDNHYVGGNTIENVTSDITLTAQYKKAWYEVSKATMENGTINISADPALNENTAEYGATVTLTPAPNTNYAFESIDAYKADDDETKVTLTPAGDNYTFTMPAYAVEISATFIAQASSCDINFYAAGNTTTPMTTISKKRGEAYEITEVGTAVDGFTFVGWATQEYATEQEEAIITITSVTPPTDSEEAINLYAVYKRAAVEAAYEKVTAAPVAPATWEGDYLLSYSEKVFAVGKIGGEEGIGKSGVKVDLSEKINDDKIASADGDEYKVIIEACTGGYLLKTQDGLYNYKTSDANGINTGKKEDATTYPITIYLNEGGTVHMGLDNGAKFQYNTGGYFRFYKSTTSMKELTLYKLGEASYFYTTSPVVKYTISYDLNGGSKGEGNFDEQQVDKGNDATVTESIPTKTGYTFVNWKDADENTYNHGATISNVQKDIKLVAQYNVNKYVVTHTATNGSINVETLDTDGKAEYGATLTISLVPETGYEIDPTVELKAYKTDDEETPVSITDNTITMPDYAITIVAGFRAETPEYTINVQSNNTEQGTVSISEETETTLSLKEGDERTILAWPNEGYRFVNWTTEDDITITDADNDEATFTVKTSGATITANFEAIPSVTYTKITTTDDLAYNDKVIIVAATADKAMSATQGNNNRGEVEITRGNEGATITLATDEVAVLDVLSGNAAQTFAFHDVNGYLYAASSSSNHMKSEDELDANGNGNWNVAISEGSATIVAQGTNTRKWMLYNKNSSLFSCYQTTTSLGTTYQYVSLYRIVSDDQVLVTLMNGEEVFARYRANKNSSITLNGFIPTVEGKVVLGWTDGETVYAADDEVAVAETNITLNIKVCDFTLEDKAAGAFATICLPRKIDHVENATLFHILDGDITKVNFESVTDFSEEQAGMPYLVQVTADGDVNFYYAEAGEAVSDPVTPEDANGFVGRLAEGEEEITSETALLVSGGKLYQAGTGCYLTQHHAYIEVSAINPVAKAPNMAARRVTLYNAEAQTPTNLNGLNGNMKAQKVMKDGQLYIIRDTKMYNAQGIEVQ